ncbi:MAG: nucleotidyl transferase AbiEii/AbiGii toxin family protein [Burkholderiales bacterium]
MLLDFSTTPELRGLALVAGALQSVAAPLGVEFFLMGAAARDLIMRHGHGIEAQRATVDVDFAVMVRDWQAYEALRTALIASGAFSARPGPATHRLRHTSGPRLPLDIVPFGGVERPDRTFAWPPEHSIVFDCFGVAEAFAASITARLPDGVQVRVAPIAAQVVLKLSAWQDRKHTHPGRDASDLLLFLGRYMDCGNLDRMASEHQDLFDADDFDYVEAGVRLLARDVAPLVGRAGIERLLTILVPEADEAGPLLLAQQSGLDREHARRLLEVLCDELAGAM